MSVIKPTKTIEIPANAVVRNGIVHWADSKGKKRSGKLTKTGRVLVETDTWQIRYRDENGKEIRESVKVKNRDAAVVILAQREKEIERIKMGIATREETATAKSRKETLEEQLKKYQQHLLASGDSEIYVKKTLRRIVKLLAWIGITHLKYLTREAIEEWITGERKSGKRAFGTINAYTLSVQLFCNWAQNTNRLQKSPLHKMRPLNSELDKRKKRRALSEDEMKRLFSVADADHELIYRFLAGTGLRSNELAQATLSQFDFERCRFTVEAAKTKNKKADVLPIRKDLMERLRQYVEQRQIKSGQNIFIYNTQQLLKQFYADLGRAGIERKTDDGKSVDVHALRKTFGTMLARAGVPLTTTQRLMRHSTPLLTAKLYIDVAPIDLENALEKLPEF